MLLSGQVKYLHVFYSTRHKYRLKSWIGSNICSVTLVVGVEAYDHIQKFDSDQTQLNFRYELTLFI